MKILFINFKNRNKLKNHYNLGDGPKVYFIYLKLRILVLNPQKLMPSNIYEPMYSTVCKSHNYNDLNINRPIIFNVIFSLIYIKKILVSRDITELSIKLFVKYILIHTQVKCVPTPKVGTLYLAN